MTTDVPSGTVYEPAGGSSSNAFGEERNVLLGIVKTSMDAVVERSLRDPSYPWIDTKLDIRTGRDFDPRDAIRGKNVVYSWIQGRGLEALAEHLAFFEIRGLLGTEEGGKKAGAYRRVLFRAAEALLAAREKGGGHLFFSLDRKGFPLRWDAAGGWRPKALSPDDPYNLSDIFGSRGLYAASRFLPSLRAAAEAYCDVVYEAVLRGSYESDQQQFDPKNPVGSVPGRFSHAPFMLQLPTLTLFLRTGRTEAASGSVLAAGLGLIEGILSRHANSGGRFPGLAPYDFVEFLNEAGGPYEGKPLSDPGHALEFTGLAAGFCSAALEASGLAGKNSPGSGFGKGAAGEGGPAGGEEASGGVQRRIAEIRLHLVRIFERSFSLGFDEGRGGIVKLIDLAAGRPLNSDMPWWSLPETMRAAAECAAFTEGEERTFFRKAYGKCLAALVGNYVSEKAFRLCIQTRGPDGRPVDVIPAVPDADPGYHTGLSLLRCLELAEPAEEPAGT